MQTVKKSKSKKQTIGLLVFVLFGLLMAGPSLKMGFTSQAPEGNWKEPWYNDCEEVSIVMVDSYYNKRKLTPAVAKKEILRIIGLKEKAYGFSLDENADKMVDIINNFLNWKAWVAENPTIREIKEQIDKAHPVLALTDGRLLDNRYYTTNEYHVFVISGYDDDKEVFITQDAGTYHGHDYEYSYSVIEDALHDYNSTDVSLGRRVAIFTSPEEKKTDESKVEVNPTLTSIPTKIPTPTSIPILTGIDSAKNEEIKNNDLPEESKNNIDNKGLINIMKSYLARLAEWIKIFFRKLYRFNFYK